MRHPVRCLLLAACLAVTGSAAHAAPARGSGKVAKKAKHRAKAQVAPPVDPDDIEIEEDADADADEEVGEDEEEDEDRVAFDDDRDDDDRRYDDEDDDRDERYGRGDRYDDDRYDRDDDRYDRYARYDRDDDDRYERDDDRAYDDDRGEPRTRRARKGARPRGNDWSVAIGPYLWASSVEADISIGGANVGSGVDFMEMSRHASYGIEVLAEVRYRRFALTTDFMYGVVAINGDKEVGPLMVGLDGTASSLLIDAAAGYMITGGDHALLSVEGRAGVRYQRTKIEGAVAISGSEVASAEQVMAGADALAGARVFLRPFRRLYLSSTVDVGVVGSSTLTWSAAVDASARVTSRVLLTLGWRTLTMNSDQVSLVMHGPRVAVQLLF